MPILDITCAPRVSPQAKEDLARVLPHGVSLAVECPEEPYDGDLQGGDVIMRFHETSAADRLELDILIEVNSKWFPSRDADRQRRANDIHGCAESVLPRDHHIGVYLALPVASWAESE